jgi:hypothetical protein
MIIYIYIYLTAIVLTPGGSSTAHTQTTHIIQRTEHDDDNIYIYIFIYLFNRNWVGTRWQQYSSHLHTTNIQNTEKGTYITITELNIHNNKKIN